MKKIIEAAGKVKRVMDINFKILVAKNDYKMCTTLCKLYRLDKTAEEALRYYRDVIKSTEYQDERSSRIEKISEFRSKNRYGDRIMMFASKPMLINKNTVEHLPLKSIVFNILHEIGHYQWGRSEVMADQYAKTFINKVMNASS